MQGAMPCCFSKTLFQNPKLQTFEHLSTFFNISGLVILERPLKVFVGGISDRDGEEEAVAVHLMRCGW